MIVTCVWLATGRVVMEKLALVCPAGTVTETGTVATLVLPLLSCTCKPPAGAGPLSVTVPMAVLPPTTLLGLIVID